MSRALAVLLTAASIPAALFAGEEVYIGLHADKQLSRVMVAVDTGKYAVWANGDLIMDLWKGEQLTVEPDGGNVRVIGTDTVLRSNFIIRLNGLEAMNRFAIKLHPADSLWLRYEGDLLVTSSGGHLKLINIVDLDCYLKGVIRAEIGPLNEPEFVKAMTVVSRTYMLRNRYRHQDSGFDLCDQTHCQVYTGENDVTDMIRAAVDATRDEVIVDSRNTLVNAVFHSNSGGRTTASRDAWGSDVSYLRSKEDPYSRNGLHYAWEQRLPLTFWRGYLAQKTGKPVKEFLCDTVFVRSSWYLCNGVKIPMRDIRRDLQLKSAFFIVQVDGEEVVFRGRGYGHGVGMSQEGANRMAELGFKYRDIIQFYYEGTSVVSRNGDWKASVKQP